MTTRRRAAAAILLGCVTLASCSAQDSSATGGSSLGTPRPGETPFTTSATTPDPMPTGKTRATPSVGQHVRASGAPSVQRIRIEIVMPACIERERPVAAVIRTDPGTMLVASAAYSDGQSHYNYWVGVADPRGEYSVTWAPPRTAPLGAGKFLVGAQSDAGGDTAVKQFRLEAPGTCA